MNIFFSIISALIMLFFLFIVIEKAVQRGIDSSRLGVLIQEYIEERRSEKRK